MIDLRPYNVEEVNTSLKGIDFFKQMTDPKNPGKFEELVAEVIDAEKTLSAYSDSREVSKERYEELTAMQKNYDNNVQELIRYFDEVIDAQNKARDAMNDYTSKALLARDAQKEKMQKNVDAELDKANKWYEKNVQPLQNDYNDLFDIDQELEKFYDGTIDFSAIYDDATREYLLNTEKERIKNNWSNEDQEESIDLSIEPVSPDPFVNELKAGLGGKDGDLVAGGSNYDLYMWMLKTYPNRPEAAEWYLKTGKTQGNPFLPGGSYVPRASRFNPLGSVASIAGVDSATDAATAAASTGEKKGEKKKKKKNTPMLAHFKPEGKNLFERLSKLRKPNQFFNPDDIKPVFPENPPEQLDPTTGMHPRYGKQSKRYRKLDPMSANAMPPTGDPETDAIVDQQRTKERPSQRKQKYIKTMNKIKNIVREDFTNITTGNKVGQTFRHIASGQTISTGGALGGVESVPTFVELFGDAVPGPSASSYALQGYAKPLGNVLKRKKTEDTNKKLKSSQEFLQKIDADVMMDARVSPTTNNDAKYMEDLKNIVSNYNCLLYTSPSPRDVP